MKCKDTGDFFRAWEEFLRATEPLRDVDAHDRPRLPLGWLVRWMCAEPARLAGLQKYKGAIAAGYDATVIFKAEERFKVRLDPPDGQ